MNLDIFNFIMFAIPGFFFVWSYTKAKGTKIESDFEYLAFSFFWGLIIFVFINEFVKRFGEEPEILFKNIYATMIAISLVSIFLGNLVGGRLDVYIDKFFSFLGKKIRGK